MQYKTTCKPMQYKTICKPMQYKAMQYKPIANAPEELQSDAILNIAISNKDIQ
jgi:hypothetical protein